MAQTIAVRGANVKIQSVITQLLLVCVTFGIYFWFWYYRVNREMKDVGTAVGDPVLANSSPAMSILAITLGSIVIVPAIVSQIKLGSRVEQTQRALGMNPPSFSFGVHILLFLLGLYPLYVQAELNKTWQMAQIVQANAQAA